MPRFCVNGSRLLAWGAGFVTVAMGLVVVAALLKARLESPMGFDGDESDHALWGATVYLDLARGDLPAFLRHLYAQNRFPPLYSVLQLPFLVALGVNPLAHRLVATFWLLVLLVAVYLCVAWGERRPLTWPGACLAVLLAIGCPELLAVATTVYFEPAGLALMLLTYAAYLRARADPSSRWAWVAGGLYLASWFLKWQFGLLMTLVLVAHVLARSRLRWRILRADPVAGRLLLPAWGAVVLWLANPYQLREFLLYLTGVPKSSGWQQALSEGLALQARLLFTAYSATVPAALLSLAGLLYGLLRLRRPGAALFTLSALAALATSANLRGGAEARIMLWLMPPLWVLAGLAVNEMLAAWRRDPSGEPAGPLPTPALLLALVWVLLLGGVGNAALGFRQAEREIRRPYMVGLWDFFDLLTSRVPPDRALCMIDCWAHGIPPLGVKWAYLARYGRGGWRYDDLQVWEYPPPDPEERDVLHFRAPWRARLPAPATPPPPPDPVQALRRAGIEALAVCAPLDEPVADWKAQVLQAGMGSLGFRPIAEYRRPGASDRVLLYLRPGPP